MKLRAEVVERLMLSPKLRKELTVNMGVSGLTIMRNLKINEDNNCLTKINALQCIQKLLKVKKIEQLLDIHTNIPSFEDMCTDANIEIIPVESEQIPDQGEIVKVEGNSNNSIFTFAPSNQTVRVEPINGEPWFVAKDVCDILGISKYRDFIANNLDKDERVSVHVDTLGGKQEMSAVSESGLYVLIFQSRKPEARAFRKWVTSEVLPTLRKTGEYQIKKRRSHNAPVPTDPNIAQLLSLIEGYLQKGDQKVIAMKLGVSPVSVNNILSGKTKSSTILQTLYEKALENRQNGFVNAYSNEFVTTAISKLQ
jgi:prophage antirepressor-like protein